MKRNLLYFIYPRSCSMLHFNLQQLSKYYDIFTGTRIAAIAEDDSTIDVLPLLSRYQLEFDEIVRVPNDSQLGESSCFLDLVSRVQSIDSRESTFYAHAKGVSSDVYSRRKTTIQELQTWIYWMYRLDLENEDEVDRTLTSYPCAGCFKVTDVYPDMFTKWYYAGTFFWFNHQRFFSEKWDTPLRGRFGVEELLGNLFPIDQGYDIGGQLNLGNHYKPESYQSLDPINHNFNPSNVSVMVWGGEPDESLRQYPFREMQSGEFREWSHKTSGTYVLFVKAGVRFEDYEKLKWCCLQGGSYYTSPSEDCFLICREDFQTLESPVDILNSDLRRWLFHEDCFKQVS